jgi:hypothetical protein
MEVIGHLRVQFGIFAGKKPLDRSHCISERSGEEGNVSHVCNRSPIPLSSIS